MRNKPNLVYYIDWAFMLAIAICIFLIILNSLIYYQIIQ